MAKCAHILVGVSFRHWLDMLRRSGGMDPGYSGRALTVTLSSILAAPLRLLEQRIYGPALARTHIEQPPVFIVGHWRSGTTWLHNLMCRDRQFGYVSCLQMAAPDGFLLCAPALRFLLDRIVHPIRPMDHVPMTADSPQEEEFVMARTSPHSFYHYWAFPRSGREYFNRYVLLNDLSPAMLAGWQAAYLEVLKKTSLACGGRQLLLKNPANSGRISALRGMFPGAKFIVVHRDPYEVFASSRHMHTQTLAAFRLQSVRERDIEDNVLYFYRSLMEALLKSRDSLPRGSVTEVRYEELHRAPLDTLARVYAELALPGFAEARPDMEAELRAHADYQRMPYSLTREDVTNVNAQWGAVIDRLGYPRRRE